jgi:glycosyltransferase involved in cell wall biosynthesis
MDYAVMAAEKSAPWFQWYFKKTLLGCHGFVCCTAAMEKTLPSWLPSQKITALPNGIQAVESPASAETTESFCVLYLSNMVPTKGWQVLLAAAERICAEFPHVVFDFHGAPQQGASEADIQAVFARTGHPDRLIYHGFADAAAKKAAWAKADLFCFPTFTEALPLTLLEAMSCGLAVVASRVGGIPDALEHGDGGWLVPPNDVVALAAALREAIQSPARLDEMGRNNRLRFEANYSLAAFSSRWENYLAAQAA